MRKIITPLLAGALLMTGCSESEPATEPAAKTSIGPIFTDEPTPSTAGERYYNEIQYWNDVADHWPYNVDSYEKQAAIDMGYVICELEGDDEATADAVKGFPDDVGFDMIASAYINLCP